MIRQLIAGAALASMAVIGLSYLGKANDRHWRYDSQAALEADRGTLDIEPVACIQERVGELERVLAPAGALELDRVFVPDDSVLPAICLDFSDTMAEPGEVEYGDYLRFEPAFAARYHRNASDEVCAEGADFGAEYRVIVLPGLTGRSGETVHETIRSDVSVPDRSATLRFENRLYVLPKGSQGVPLYAVNVERVDLALYRIDERNLTQEFVQRNFRDDIDEDDVGRIRDRFGEQVWSGVADLSLNRNHETVTNLPIARLAEPAAGVYVLTAEPQAEEDDEGESAWRPARSTQWLVVSDLGLTTYRGVGGLTATVHSLQTAESLAGVRLALYGRNNRLLHQAVSDPNGVGRFPAARLNGKGGLTPELLMAFGADGDFNFFDISVSPFDLSDRGVDGRPLPGPLDAFLYAERGVYRPGERVHLTALLRNEQGEAVNGLPLTLRLLRPDEQVADERVLHPTAAGGYSTVLGGSPGARTGRWKVLAYVDPDAAPVGEASFLVEAIVPPRIEVELTQRPAGPVTPGSDTGFEVEARYLFGAAASALAAAARVRVVPDPEPFPLYSEYRFGPVDEAGDSVLLPLPGVRTDGSGRARFDFRLERLPKSQRPLRAELRAEVTDVDGRAAAAAGSVRVRPGSPLVGVRPPGEGGALDDGARALFELMVLDPDGQPLADRQLQYRLVEEQDHYQWYRDDGEWGYKRQVRDRLVAQGAVISAANGAAGVGRPLTAGRYRFEVRDATGEAFTSVRVQVGWHSVGAGPDTPDRLRLAGDADVYAPGALAKIRVEAPFAGQGELVIAGDRVLAVHPFDLPASGTTLEVPVDPAWGAGAYALVTAYRPDGGQAGRGPRRAIGVHWLALRDDERSLRIDLELPEQIAPRRTLPVTLAVTGQDPGDAVHLTLAAVDEGVLQLTDYATPDPLGHYFGKRRLGVAVRDVYGALIDGRKGRPGRVRSGAGAAGRSGTPESHIRIVSLFSGIATVGPDGRIELPLTLPDFDGRLRVTAVAWSTDRLGSASAGLTVRDPVVMLPSLPRFLAHGDESRASVLLHNLEGPVGNYSLSWSASGALSVVEGAGTTMLDLGAGQRAGVDLPLRAEGLGDGHLTLLLEGPGGLRVEREIGVGVRAPFLPETRRRLGHLAPGAEVMLGPDAAAGLARQGLSGVISVSARPDFDVPGLLSRLDLYPYGCLEQVSSRAFPLLHIERLAERWGYRSEAPVAKRLDEAVRRILDKQLDNGAFALWGPDGEEEPWLSAYALDLLQRARAAGVRVPDFAWERGLGWLRSQVEYPSVDDAESLAAQAYAIYLLARAGESPVETARYLVETAGERLPSPLAAAQLGAALAFLGEPTYADVAFDLAGKLGRDQDFRDYGSPLRDAAAIMLLRAETFGMDQQTVDQVQALAQAMADRRWLSTQEEAWLVRAADSLTGDGGAPAFVVDGSPLAEGDTPTVLRPGADSLMRGIALRNPGPEAAWYSVAVTGTPAQAPAALQQGFSIRRTLHDLSGAIIDPAAVRQGDLLVALIDGAAETVAVEHQALIVDPLPAGLEIESPRLANARTSEDLAWLSGLSEVQYSEALDDRFVAALDVEGEPRGFRVAYLVRAVSPGRYRLAPPEVEDMYKPHYRGRGEAGWLNVVATE